LGGSNLIGHQALLYPPAQRVSSGKLRFTMKERVGGIIITATYLRSRASQ
jgi:hypothetical protein